MHCQTVPSSLAYDSHCTPPESTSMIAGILSCTYVYMYVFICMYVRDQLKTCILCHLPSICAMYMYVHVHTCMYGEHTSSKSPLAAT